ncbi:rod shape-determining protein RodA [Candidatus Kaiserbacteria bacterium]|nr:rod shape-determining protein RodA [Candidatus Kaiserbacteria bacterium]
MRFLRDTDWLMLGSAVLVSLAGLVSMYSFGGASTFAEHQIIWLFLGVTAFFFCSFIDFHFLRRTGVIVLFYLASVFFLTLLFGLGSVVNGARGWFSLGSFAIQPVDIAELALILVFAKYFSRRHIEIARIRHIVVSGGYALIIFSLLFLQPDFGSAVIVAFLWLGMVLIAGIPLRRLALIAAIGLTAVSFLWFFAFAPYQKARIMTFIHPLADISGAGYNAFQSMVAVGSGGVFGKGIGYGTQSRLQFLPEHETDFIFASFAEEWGLIGTLILLSVFGLLIYRLIANARSGATNFESLFALGVATLFVVHAIIHVGMNVGLLPVTGVTLPFMSYGGSHLVTGYAALGIVNAMRRYSRSVHEGEEHEVVGVV